MLSSLTLSLLVWSIIARSPSNHGRRRAQPSPGGDTSSLCLSPQSSFIGLQSMSAEQPALAAGRQIFRSGVRNVDRAVPHHATVHQLLNQANNTLTQNITVQQKDLNSLNYESSRYISPDLYQPYQSIGNPSSMVIKLMASPIFNPPRILACSQHLFRFLCHVVL